MTPDEILNQIYRDVSGASDQVLETQPQVLSSIELVSRNINNRACVRVILACALAKTYNEAVDIRKPYTEIGDADAFSGRAVYRRDDRAELRLSAAVCSRDGDGAGGAVCLAAIHAGWWADTDRDRLPD